MPFENPIKALQGGVIISCQALPQDPTNGPEFMAAFGRAAQRGGAVGLRANGAQDIGALKAATGLPLIGIWKRPGSDGLGHIITPSVADALALQQAGADIIAGDAAERPRPHGLDAAEFIRQVRSATSLPFMADCSSPEEAYRAREAGADIVATTRFPPVGPYRPDLTALAELIRKIDVPVIAEGHFWEPEDVRRAFEAGAHAVVIGSAVTRPWLITARFVASSLTGERT